MAQLFLPNWFHYIAVSDEQSSSKQYNLGVPQWWVFTPLLFSLCVFPVSRVISASDFQFHQYADDRLIFGRFRQTNWQTHPR